MNPTVFDLILAEARKYFRDHPEEREKARKELQQQQNDTN